MFTSQISMGKHGDPLQLQLILDILGTAGQSGRVKVESYPSEKQVTLTQPGRVLGRMECQSVPAALHVAVVWEDRPFLEPLTSA